MPNGFPMARLLSAKRSVVRATVAGGTNRRLVVRDRCYGGPVLQFWQVRDATDRPLPPHATSTRHIHMPHPHATLPTLAAVHSTAVTVVIHPCFCFSAMGEVDPPQ